ncbi:L-serine ammonia-lyase, iron-sulfur-dependent, subunit alpha [Methanocaldococcus indicus]|uniref:L-serine ammonia-lyase, iron-sulfur-dependent, subunit alpha n=1 Tax=Methanocaldococcus indicus TaxID=213231 RepID=UPI003C6D838B
MIIDEILKKEVYKALGCTEVVLIGKTVAKAKPKNLDDIKKIRLVLGKEIFKNAYAVGVPNTGKFGIVPAVVAGLLSKRDDNEVFRDIDYNEELEEKIKNLIDIELVDKKVYCKVEIFADKLYSAESEEYNVSVDNKLKEQFKNLNLDDFLEYINNIPKDIKKLINDVIKTNYEITTPTVDREFLSLDFNDERFRYVLEKTVSAVYNRMIGVNKVVYAIAGSGNMGLTATVPIIAYDELTNKDKDLLIRSITLSALTTIYSSYYSGYTSAMCGCVNRGGLGALIGLSYYLGKDINKAIKGFVANLPGIVCDGGKVGCSLKIASGIFSIFLSLNSSIPYNNGIIGKDFKENIININKVANAMERVDDVIIEILKTKKI